MKHLFALVLMLRVWWCPTFFGDCKENLATGIVLQWISNSGYPLAIIRGEGGLITHVVFNAILKSQWEEVKL